MQRPETFLIYINISSVYPNLGIASLTAYLKERGMAVRQANLTMPVIRGMRNLQPFQGKSWELYREMSVFLDGGEFAAAMPEKHQQLKKVLMLWAQYLMRDDPKSVGLSLHFDNVIPCLLLAQLLKKMRPDLPIIFGGPECNGILSVLLLKTGYVDSVIEGEGEESLYRLLCRLRTSKPISIPCDLVSAGARNLPLRATAPLDMDTLPAPDYMGEIKNTDSLVALPVAFNRGCSFVCTFCHERKFWVKFRQVGVAKAIEILARLKKEYGVKRYLLSQSLSNNDLLWLKDFSIRLEQTGSDVVWGGNGRIHGKMDEAYFRALYRGGCRFFYWGIESASLPVLKAMQKGSTPRINRQVLQAAAASGIWNHTYWIFGFPSETENDLLLSVDFILENSGFIHSAFFHLYMDQVDQNADELIASQDIIEYFRISRASEREQKSLLYAQYPEFFRRLTNAMTMNSHGRVNYEEGFSDPAVLEQKHKMLTVAHLLRYFITEPEIRDELSRQFTKAVFREAYEDFCRTYSPTLAQLGDPEGGYGKLVFTRLAHGRFQIE